MWGAGHTTTLVLMGFVVYFLAINIPKNVFMGFEFIVGAMLVFLAFTTFSNKKLFRLHLHTHTHNDGTIHTHPHEHDGDHKHSHKSYIIGCVHGLAGSGSLIVLTASTLGNIETTLSFILIFGIGSVIGMVMVSGLIGLPFAFLNKIESANKTLRYIAGFASLLIGVNILYEIAIANNLFGI
jgi:ABC-type nickel/cobalt efflux system permease component RcnA